MNSLQGGTSMFPFLIITGTMVLAGALGSLILWYGRRVIESHDTWTDYGVHSDTSSVKTFDPDETQEIVQDSTS